MSSRMVIIGLSDNRSTTVLQTDDKPKSTKAAKDAKEKAGSAALAPEEGEH